MTTTETIQPVNIQPIEERITNLIDVYTQDKTEVTNLKNMLREAEQKVIDSGRNIVFMQRIAQIAGYEQNIMLWQDKLIDQFHEDHDYEWIQHHELNIATLRFDIAVVKKRKLKKYKYLVVVSGALLYVSENINAVGDTYKDYDYVKTKYGNDELELQKKFVNHEDALAYVELWKARLELDHSEKIQEEREIYQELIDAGLKYDYETARNLNRNRPHNSGLTTLEDIGIIHKTRHI
ncbi:hypothetical protein ASD24_29660 [Paenibacillus sp. Root52]|uniref:hypothetical protein n=1 Tax=Paenibacillus sp. Root52 TaxID=1736552 RepID=UPI0006F9F7AB|nr:hypothetical protein [Paenibacillus sp. Root52]KQY83606.1 hypothetical protein ASD24_29660 [Paenibacillus sp. Root52]